jgi:hypothetical protein
LRPDYPRTRHGKRVKYETVQGERMVLDDSASAALLAADPLA